MHKGFPTVALGEVLTLDQSYIEAPEPRLYPKLSVKLYGKGVVLDTSADGAALKMKRHQLAKAGQVILSEIWGKKGAIGFVPPEGDGALCTSHFFLFDVRRDKLEPKYLQAIFTANYLEEQLGVDARGTTGYAAVRPKNLLAATIPLPPLEEQRRIVARIEELAAKIEEARGLRREANEEALILLMLASKSLFERSMANHISMEDLVGRANLKNGRSIKADGAPSGIKCLRLSAMRNGRVDCTDTKPVPMSVEEASQYRVRFGDVFIVRGNGSKDLVGQAGLVTTFPKGVIFPDLFIHVPLNHQQVLPEYFVLWWNSPLMRAKIKDAAITTSGIWKINQGHITSFSVSLPPLEEQRRIVTYLDDLQAKVDALKRLQAETAAELDALLPSVLDRAFRGEL